MRMRQVFSLPFKGPYEGVLFGLAEDGSFWLLHRTGFGDDGRGSPREVIWRPADHVVPRLDDCIEILVKGGR